MASCSLNERFCLISQQGFYKRSIPIRGQKHKSTFATFFQTFTLKNKVVSHGAFLIAGIRIQQMLTYGNFLYLEPSHLAVYLKYPYTEQYDPHRSGPSIPFCETRNLRLPFCSGCRKLHSRS